MSLPNRSDALSMAIANQMARHVLVIDGKYREIEELQNEIAKKDLRIEELEGLVAQLRERLWRAKK